MSDTVKSDKLRQNLEKKEVVVEGMLVHSELNYLMSDKSKARQNLDKNKSAFQ